VPPDIPPISVGLIGYGLAGREFHAPLIQATPGLSLTAIASSRRNEIAGALPGVAVTDAGSLIEDPSVDLLVIASPHQSHYDLARRGVLAGKAVIVDKPFALTSRDAHALAELARVEDRLLSVFHNRRWDGDYVAVRQALADGLVGGASVFESRFDRFRPQVQDRWRERPGPGAGVWWDLGPHLVDQAIELFGTPDTITADIATLRQGGGAADYAHVVLEYPRRRAVLRASMLAASPGPRFVLHGTEGTLTVQGFGDSAPGRLDRGPGRAPEALVIPQDAPERFYAAARDAFLRRGPNPVTPESAAKVIRILELAEQSSQERRTVAVDIPFSLGEDSD
jgi:predicted dehydrogenase